MERRHVYGAVSVVAAALMFPGCGDGKAPVQPTPVPVAPPLQEFRLSGNVSDTASRPLAGSKVEVMDGPRAGTAATTDEAGRFTMPGTFTGNITVSGWKDGYVRETRSILPRGAPLPSGNTGGSWEIAFSLAPLGPSANIAGMYTLTLTADRACTNLPVEARTRTYTATIVPGGRSTYFLARLSDARFLSTVPCPPGRLPESCTYNQIGIGLAGDYASIGVEIVEQLDETTSLVFGAGAEGSVGPMGITAPLYGQFLYCPGEPALIDQGTWGCVASAGVQCDSRNHQLTLVRR